MTQNIGGVEKAIRIALGIALLVWGFVLSNPINFWGAIGIVPLVTALIGWCPAWSLIGINTNK
ncbi:MAG: DUF2892 domain-containing protein [Pseudomonadota bacterium]